MVVSKVRRGGPATLLSVLAHLALLALLTQVVRTPLLVERIFGVSKPPSPVQERVEFVAVAGAPGAVSASTEPRRSIAPAPSRAAERALEAPATREGLPPGPPAAATAQPLAPPASGPVAGGGGPTRGVQPTFSDPRVWVPDPPFVYAPKSAEERLDSALLSSLERYKDSLARYGYAPNRFERGDWTVEKDGKKYGIDREYIRLGRFALPTALLALLPLNKVQANPIAAERERSMAALRGDILYHAEQAMNEEEFRRAVKAIRERKDREQKAKQEQQGKGKTPPTVSPGERPPP